MSQASNIPQSTQDAIIRATARGMSGKEISALWHVSTYHISMIRNYTYNGRLVDKKETPLSEVVDINNLNKQELKNMIRNLQAELPQLIKQYETDACQARKALARLERDCREYSDRQLWEMAERWEGVFADGFGDKGWADIGAEGPSNEWQAMKERAKK